MTEQEFWDILAAAPHPSPIYYRLYYNEDGSPRCYTMEDLPGSYIEIDLETYHCQDNWVRVVDGKIVKINHTLSVQKLVQSNQGTACHPQNIAVIDPTSNTLWSKQTYAFKSN